VTTGTGFEQNNSGMVALVDLAESAVVGAIETSSVNSHRLVIAPNGRWLYTENEEDASISVIDLPARPAGGDPASVGGPRDFT
jgi:hypothetical protein